MARKNKRSYGSGCILQRGNGFAIRWRETEITSEGIRRVLRYETLGPVSRREATQVLQARMAGSQLVRRQAVTFRDLAANWEKTVLPMYKYSTRKHHTDILQRKLVPRFGDSRVDQITRQDVQELIAELQVMKYAPHSIDHYHNVLSTILTKAVEWGYVPSNPAKGVTLPRIEAIRPQWVLKVDEAASLLESLPACPRAIVGLALLTGMRRGELFALRWSGFDEGNATLTISEAIYDHVIDTPKTRKSRRVIPLAPAAVKVLTDWRKLAIYTSADSFIFSGRDGVPRDQARILRDYVAPACKKLGFRNATWLTFRRTFCTWADAAGYSSRIRSELMGNSPEINEAIYTKVIPDTLRSAVDAVGNKLFTDCSLASNLVN